MRSLPKTFEPLNCTLWRNPETLKDIYKLLETVEIYLDDSHERRCLMKCRECRQLYFYQSVEFVDYMDGEDPQYRTHIPVTAANDAVMLSDLPGWDIAAYIPAIHSAWPKGQERPSVFWVGRTKSE